MAGDDQHEAMLAAAVRMLLKWGEVELALALSEAELADLRREVGGGWTVELVAPVSVSDLLHDSVLQTAEDYYANGPTALEAAFGKLVPPDAGLYQVVVRARAEPVAGDWREQVRAMVEAPDASNQGLQIGTSPIHTYNGLNYRSKTEIEVAKVLDERGVLFWPNARASRSRVTREADFLVISKGRLGILEVDGATHDGRAAEDHRRDLYFEERGIPVYHFTAEDAYNAPSQVVDKFLSLLAGPNR